MTADAKDEAGTDPRGARIEELARLATTADVIERLREITGGYGKVMAVSQMASIAHRGEDIDLYRVCFERTVDAMAASRDLNCYLLGFSTLVVQVRQPGGRAARAALRGDIVIPAGEGATRPAPREFSEGIWGAAK